MILGWKKNKRTLTLTHKIDPKVDDERDFIGSSLVQTDLIKRTGYVSPSDSVLEAYTATSRSYHSDGKMLLIELQ